MQRISICDVSEYIKAINQINDNDPEDIFHRPKELLFRGQSNEHYKLVPSLGRYRNGQEDICFVERNMIETAKYKMPNVFSKDLEPIELLSILQHYGIPTRLLDLTENALVALFFACVSNQDKTGEVFVFKNFIDDVADYPVVNAVADSYRFAKGTLCPLELFYSDVIQQPYFLEQKNTNEICNKDEKDGGQWIAECCKTPFFVRASTRLTRQQIQRGRYILFPNEIIDSETNPPGHFKSRIEPLAKDHECIIGQITIQADCKEAIIREMRVLGIDRGMLFADSIDISCEEIKKEFYNQEKANVLYAGYFE